MFLIEDLRDLKYFDGLRKILDDNHCRYDLRKIQHLGAAYDTCSVMHYGPYAFSVGNNLHWIFLTLFWRHIFISVFYFSMPSDWPFVSYYFSRSAVFQRLWLERREGASWGREKASQTLISGECNSWLLMLTLMMEMIQRGHLSRSNGRAVR